MALKKAIRQQDGVTTSYHRILYVTVTTNSHNSIAVVSYVDEEARVSDAVSAGEGRPYRQAITYETDYTPDMTIKEAYNWLKALPDYEGAEDA
jgi:hypothetical protein